MLNFKFCAPSFKTLNICEFQMWTCVENTDASALLQQTQISSTFQTEYLLMEEHICYEKVTSSQENS